MYQFYKEKSIKFKLNHPIVKLALAPFLALVLLGWTLATIQPAQATAMATCTVGSFAYANLAAALADSSCTNITFSENYSETGSWVINHSVTIEGSELIPNTLNTTLSGGNSQRIFEIGADNLDVTIEFLELERGRGLDGGAVYNPHSGSTLTIKEVTFSQNTATDDGGAIYSSGPLTVNNSTFNDSTAADDGGAIYSSNSTQLDVRNSDFNRNEATDTSSGNGGAIFASNGGITANNNSFSNNSSGNTGGAIFMIFPYNGASIQNSDFIENSATYGGAIHRGSGTEEVTIQNSTFMSNTHTTDGGAIYARGNLTINDVVFTGQSGGVRGGAIYNDGGNIVIKDSDFLEQGVTKTGGAIRSMNGDLTIDNLLFDGNYVDDNDSADANEFGGAIYFVDGDLDITNTVFQNNASETFGGGVQTFRANVTMQNSYFMTNSAKAAGGAYFDDNSVITIETTTFTGNSSDESVTNQAAAITSEDSSIEIINSTFNQNDGAATLTLQHNSATTDIVMTLTNATVYENSGHGLQITAPNSQATDVNIILINSIVADNTGTDCKFFHASNPNQMIDASAGYNMDSDGTCLTSAGTGNETVGSIGLADIGDFGGPTPTNPPLLTSPALNKIPNGVNGCGTTITTDQRGISRPQEGLCDIGAVEMSDDIWCSNLLYDFPYTVGTVLPANHAQDLINAISCANANLTADVITLAANVTLTETHNTVDGENNGLPLITDDLTLNGAGFTISRDASYDCSDSYPQFRLLSVADSADVTLDNLGLENGCVLDDETGFGGAILNGGYLALQNGTTLSGNDADGKGGAIYNGGLLAIEESSLINNGNDASTSLQGGSIYNDGFMGIVDSGIGHNDAYEGGGVYNEGYAVISATTVYSNAVNFSLATPGNYAGIYNSGTMELQNSTLTHNISWLIGGIFNDITGTLTIVHSTIANNLGIATANGVANKGELELSSSLLANLDSTDCENDGGTVNDGGYNLIVNTTNCVNAGNGNVLGEDPLLEPLQANGGFGLTYLFPEDSPAYDQIPAGAGCGSDTTEDQRNVSRPQSTHCDIGAIERIPVVLTATLVSSTSVELTWSLNDAHDGFLQWRSTTPYEGYNYLSDLYGPTMGVVVNPDQPYFYKVTGEFDFQPAEESNEVGVFSFAIVPGTP